MTIKYWRLRKLCVLATTPLVAFSIVIFNHHSPTPPKMVIKPLAVKTHYKQQPVSRLAVAYQTASVQTEYVAPTPLPTVLPTVAPKFIPRSFEEGMASFYSIASSSTHTASGQYFNESALTVAHKTLPFGTKVRINNLNNGESVIATVNDRGPYISGRIVDLSPATNTAINCNLCSVRLEVL